MEKPFRTNVEEVQETKPFTTNDGEIPKETPFATNAEEIQAEKREDVVSEKVCLPACDTAMDQQTEKTQEPSNEKVRPIQYEEAETEQEKTWQNSQKQKEFFARQKRKRGGFNFNLILNEKIIRIEDTKSGEESKRSYKISVFLHLKNGDTRHFPSYAVEANKAKTTAWLQDATDSLADLPSTSAQKASFMNVVQRCLETQGKPEEWIYPNAGWRNVPGLGYRFVYGGGIVGQPGVKIHTDQDLYSLWINEAALGKMETFNSVMNMGGICRNRRASTLLLVFTHAALLETLFELANFPINFVFGIVGITNARKTSLALEIAQIFHREEKRADAEFTATSCGLEKMLGKYKDGVVIIDDFRPGETKGEQQQLRERLRTLVRFYGNRVPKQRMDDYGGNKNRRYFPIQGGCVLTMEWVSGVQSSLSRMFLCEINREEVQNEILAEYQKIPWLVPTHFYDFLAWATGNFDRIVNYLRENAHDLRTQHRFAYGRYGEMYATFLLTADILSGYAQERGFWKQDNSNDFLNTVMQMALDELRVMEERLKESDRGQIALNALAKAVAEGQVQPVWLTEESCRQREEIYEDLERIFIRKKELQRLAIAYAKENDLAVVFSEEELIRLMEGLGVLEIYTGAGKNERSRKLPCQRGNTLRYLYVNKKAMEARLSDG